MTHRHQNGRGSLWVDRVFRGVGRIRRASGTSDRDVHQAIDTMLTQLYQQGRFDLLESLRDKKLSLMEVYAEWRVKGVERLPSAGTLGPVIPRWEGWVATLGTEHRRVASAWGKKVLVQHLPDGAAIRALPEVVRAIQVSYAAQPRSANLMRSYVMAFLRDTVGRGSPLYNEVYSLRPVKQPRKAPRNKMALADVRQVADALGPRLAPTVWTLALTGMRPKELWVTPWRVMPDRVRIEGSKSAGSFRDVPLLGVSTRPPVAYVTFRKAFKAKFSEWRVYDLRHAYAGLLEEAGVPRARRLIYMGRGPKDVQDIYEFREISEYLNADAERIMAHLDQLGGIRPTLKVVGKK
jgi:integrase